ncbi:MAG: linear amide C-N hydrolase [Deltaproteobacteria bacterium]|nr:linear amide C-N hydrolase [Deltaproteobacteria bacterium]
MKRTLAMAILGSVIFYFSSQADCCTVFSVKNSDGRQVAKNFDWYIGDGLVAVNPRGARRIQAQKTNAHPIEWVSQYGSVSLTPFAPGFPVSGMNEKGLVVESLHQLDFRQRLIGGNRLISLEWVQYVLDRFKTVEEVKRFAAQNGFGQVILPVHFFISDESGDSAIVSGQGDNIQVVSGKQLPLPVLANRAYHKDLAQYRKFRQRSWLQKLFSNDGSDNRFGIVAGALNNGSLPTQTAIFKLLQAARIPSLTKWQIVWNQTHKSVTWRFFEGHRPQPGASINFKQLDFSCRARPLVSSTQSRQGAHFAPYSELDRTLATVRMQAIENALHAELSDDFVLAFAKPTQCQ